MQVEGGEDAASSSMNAYFSAEKTTAMSSIMATVGSLASKSSQDALLQTDGSLPDPLGWKGIQRLKKNPGCALRAR